MAGLLVHSPARIVARLIVQRGLGALPPALPWPVYHSNEPPDPDNVITTYTVAGRLGLREMVAGSRDEEEGVQVRVRAGDDEAAHNKARAIANAFDADVFNELVTIDGTQYLAQSVRRTSGPIQVGYETPTSKRRIYTVNALCSIRVLA